MILKIFYSWQMQTSTTYNRNFIRSCIEKAIKEVCKTNPFKEVKFELHDGVRGKSGTPAIADTIIEKQISDADIFIADLTIVNFMPRWLSWPLGFVGYKHRPLHNNNVIHEHGVARNELTTSRIIAVMNSAFGAPSQSDENITFDLRHLSYPIEYNYTKPEQRENVKAELVSRLKSEIREVALFALEHNRSRFKPFAVFDEWKKLHPTDQKFVVNEKIATISKTILESVAKQKSVIRFLGLSGLGKTRILLELFKPVSGDEESILRTGKVLYQDCNADANFNIYNGVNEIVSSEQDYIIVLDNCSSENCRKLIPVVQREDSKVSMITIDNNPEELERNKISKADYLVIELKDLSDVVDNIVDDDFPDLTAEENKKIKEFAQGIPMMAVLLGDSIKKGEKFIGKLDDKFLLDKLLGRQAQDPETKTLLRTSSLFNHFGYYDDLLTQFQFIGTNQHITITQNAANVTLENFHQMINHYLGRQIFEKKGRFLSMRPFPLAMYLAQEWLETCTSERLMGVILAIAGLQDPDRTDLSQALAEQMRFLNYNERAVEIVDQITGPNSPFDDAKVLNTELGSRLFRSFVEVNPNAIAQNLYRNYVNKTTDELFKVDEGRRNLVWVLEKACFDKRTFAEAAKVLFKFAVAENESWSNNATGQLLQLFKVFLAGTEADLQARLTIIKWGLDQKEDRFRELSVMAMGRALSFGHFMRSGGAETQGTKVLEDHQPTFEEIGAYWEPIIKMLVDLIKTDKQFAPLALEQITSSVRGVASAGFGNLLTPYLFEIASTLDNWDQILNPIKSTIKYEAHRLGEDGVNKLRELYKLVTKDDYESRYNRVMVQHLFDFEDDILTYENKIAQSVKELAKEFANDRDNWDERIPLIYKVGQYNSYMLGKEICDALNGELDGLMILIKKSIAYIKNLERNSYDAAVLGGMYAASNGELQNEFLKQVRSESSVRYLLFYLLSVIETGYKESEELFSMVDIGEASVEEFSNFKRTGFTIIDEDTYLAFIRNLFNYGSEGYLVAYHLMFRQAYSNEDRKKLFLPLLRECIIEVGVVHKKGNRSIDNFQWWETVKMILINTDDTDFADRVNRGIVDSITFENSYHLDHSVQQIYKLLMERYFDTVWPYVSANLLKKEAEYQKFYGLKHILGSTIGNMRGYTGMLFYGKIDEVFKWCGENLPLAPSRLAELVPVFGEKPRDDHKATWHPISRRLVDEFGDDDEVLSHLSANIGTYGWTGSVVPYLQQQMDIMEELKDHQLASVAEWARKFIVHLTAEIRKEHQRDEEWDLR